MFRASFHRLAARFADEIDHLLADDFEFEDEDFVEPDPAAGGLDEVLQYHREHPHRAPLSRPRDRRPGTTPAAPAHCVTPLRAIRPQRQGSVGARPVRD